MSEPDDGYWSGGTIALWVVLAGVSLLIFGPAFVAAFRPPADTPMDFLQEWLSVRNYRTGRPVYVNQNETLRVHLPQAPADRELLIDWNAHPPAAVLLAVPFGGPDYPAAHLAWNLATLPLLAVAVWLVLRELGVPVRVWSALPAVTLALPCAPLVVQVIQGQLNAVLGFLIAAAWVADRRRLPVLAGAAVGAAAAIKLSPGFVIVYFVGTRQWRAVLAAAVAFAGLNAAALGLFGWDAFDTYVRQVLPGLGRFVRDWRNAALDGLLRRALDPDPRVSPPLVGPLPAVAAAAGWAARIGLAVGCGWLAWRAGDSRAARDRAYAAAAAALMLASPITWNHYYLMLVVPVALLWQRLTGPGRWLFWPLLVLLWVPDFLVPRLVFGGPRGWALAQTPFTPFTAAENLFPVSVVNYVLILFFALTLLLPAGDPPAGEPDRLDRRPYGELNRPAESVP